LLELIEKIKGQPNVELNRTLTLLLEQLRFTENRIRHSRRRYNEQVTLFNAKLRVFPRNLLARMLGTQSLTLFQANSDTSGE